MDVAAGDMIQRRYRLSKDNSLNITLDDIVPKQCNEVRKRQQLMCMSNVCKKIKSQQNYLHC